MNSRTIRCSFDLIAERYDRYAALEQEVAARLLERAVFRRSDPDRILDLGCGTGAASVDLGQMFAQARIVSLDASPAMLGVLRRRSEFSGLLNPVCADLSRLPFAARSVDLVYSNMAVHWCAQPMRLFTEIRRILRPGGMVLFSTLGANSMSQLRVAWQSVDTAAQAPEFADLMELGDALVASGFREPVMDTDQISLSFPSLEAMFEELEGTGNALLFGDWHRMKNRLEDLEQAFLPLRVGERFPLGFEIVYGVAFGPEEGQPRRTGEGEIATFSVDSLLKTRPRGNQKS